MSCWKGFREWVFGPKNKKQKYQLKSSLWLDDPLLDEDDENPYYNTSFVLDPESSSSDNEDDVVDLMHSANAVTDESRYENMLLHDSVIDAHVAQDSIAYAEKYLMASDISTTSHGGRNGDHSLNHYASCIESTSNHGPENCPETGGEKDKINDQSQGTRHAQGSFGDMQRIMQSSEKTDRQTEFRKQTFARNLRGPIQPQRYDVL